VIGRHGVIGGPRRRRRRRPAQSARPPRAARGVAGQGAKRRVVRKQRRVPHPERATTPTTMRPTTRLRPPVPGDAAKPERKAGVERARVHAQFGTASLRVRVAARQARVGRLPRVRARRRLLVAHHLAPHGHGRGGELKPARHAPRALRSVLLLPEWTGLWTCVQSN